MLRFIAILVVAAWAGVVSPLTLQAQDIRINPIPPKVTPQWTKVPGAPGVYYAPNVPTDVFKYQGKYYFFWEGYLYQSKKTKGPWKTVKKPPAVFFKIDPSMFKTVRPETLPPSLRQGPEQPPAPTAPPMPAPPATKAPPAPPWATAPAPEPPAAPAAPEGQ
jgi:hypothetical protein